MKKTFILLLLVIWGNTNFAQEQVRYNLSDSVNPNISCRFEYVTCKLEWLYLFEDPFDYYFGTHLKSTEDEKVYKIFIGAKELYRFLYPERSNPEFIHLYISVGKMLQWDTLYLENSQITQFLKYYAVNEDTLKKISENSFLDNAHAAIAQIEQENSISNELGYYFDRLFHNTIVGHQHSMKYTQIRFNFRCTNPQGYGYLGAETKIGKIFEYKYNDIGVNTEAEFIKEIERKK